MTPSQQRRATQWIMMGVLLLALGRSVLVSPVRGLPFLALGVLATAVLRGRRDEPGEVDQAGAVERGARQRGGPFLAFVLLACVSVVELLFPR